MSETASGEVLNLPMDDNDSGASSVRGYLVALLVELWRGQEGFNGKRPFGNSGWSSDLMLPLVKAGYIQGRVDSDGYLDDCDDATGQRLIFDAIRSLATPSPPPAHAADESGAGR
jgi:hypothetical protein